MRNANLWTKVLASMISSLICSSAWAGSITGTSDSGSSTLAELSQAQSKTVSSMVVIPQKGVSTMAAAAAPTLAEQTKIVSQASVLVNSLSGQITDKRTAINKAANSTQKTTLQNELSTLQTSRDTAQSDYSKQLETLLEMRKNPGKVIPVVVTPVVVTPVVVTPVVVNPVVVTPIVVTPVVVNTSIVTSETPTLAEQTKIVNQVSALLSSLAGQITDKRTAINQAASSTQQATLKNELIKLQTSRNTAQADYSKQLEILLEMRKNPTPIPTPKPTPIPTPIPTPMPTPIPTPITVKDDPALDSATTQSVDSETLGKLTAQAGQTPSVTLNAAGLFNIKDSLDTLLAQTTDPAKKQTIQKIYDTIAKNGSGLTALISISGDTDGFAAQKLQSADGKSQYIFKFSQVALSKDGKTLWLTIPAESLIFDGSVQTELWTVNAAAGRANGTLTNDNGTARITLTAEAVTALKATLTAMSSNSIVNKILNTISVQEKQGSVSVLVACDGDATAITRLLSLAGNPVSLLFVTAGISADGACLWVNASASDINKVITDKVVTVVNTIINNCITKDQIFARYGTRIVTDDNQPGFITGREFSDHELESIATMLSVLPENIRPKTIHAVNVVNKNYSGGFYCNGDGIYLPTEKSTFDTMRTLLHEGGHYIASKVVTSAVNAQMDTLWDKSNKEALYTYATPVSTEFLYSDYACWYDRANKNESWSSLNDWYGVDSKTQINRCVEVLQKTGSDILLQKNTLIMNLYRHTNAQGVDCTYVYTMMRHFVVREEVALKQTTINGKVYTLPDFDKVYEKVTAVCSTEME